MTAPKAAVTADLMKALRKHYLKSDGAGQDWNGGIYVEEVGLNGGYANTEVGYANRRCDAIYAGFTSASGRLLVGHEVKTSRSDWLAELKKIGKADFWHDNCHKWFLVVNDASIVHDGELPEGWGLMAPRGNGITTLVAATYRPITPEWTAVRSIMSRYDTERVELVRKAVDKERIKRDAEVAKMREEYRGIGHSTPQQALVDEVLRKAKVLMGTDSWITMDADVVASVLADAVKVSDATKHANAVLRRAIEAGRREAGQLATLFNNSFGPLGEILKEMSQ